MQGLIDVFANLLGTGPTLSMVLAYFVCIHSLIGFITIYAMFAIWMERKVAAHIQVRLGPMETGGWHGWAQSPADALKLLFKEDLIPAGANKFLFWIAPALVFCGVFTGFIVVPFAEGIQIVDLELGVFFIVAIASVEVIGVIMAGWSSNSKYSLFGAVREAAQVVSYELPSATALLPPVLIVGSLTLGDFNTFQAEHGWLILHNPFMPIAALIFFISSLAGCKRAPFDLPEAESELVSGFHTEYSGMRFSFFGLEEFVSMFLVSAVTATLFFGGYTLPFDLLSIGAAPDVSLFDWLSGHAELGQVDILGSLTHLAGPAVFIVKVFVFIFIQMWLRWTLPRLRVDQVMVLGYKFLLPWALFTVVGTALFEGLGWGWCSHS
ncbi:MAG: NADH-quinone oxidoreductase subunit NuoH [Planctomycetota bacterium]|nr:MAG: NADH-quinone oxidoreductase subunit NuoH [Planctomycetota bacterium]